MNKINRRSFMKMLAVTPLVGLVKAEKPKENPYLPNDYKKRVNCIQQIVDASLHYCGNMGVVVCKDQKSRITLTRCLFQHPTATLARSDNLVTFCNGSKVLLISKDELWKCDGLEIGWFGMDYEVNTQPLVKRLWSRLRRKNVSYYWFTFES